MCDTIVFCFVVVPAVAIFLSMLTCSLFISLNAVQRQQGYASLQDEAVRVFNSLQEMETLADTVPIIQGILQTCHDLRPLRDEVFLMCSKVPLPTEKMIKRLFQQSRVLESIRVNIF